MRSATIDTGLPSARFHLHGAQGLLPVVRTTFPPAIRHRPESTRARLVRAYPLSQAKHHAKDDDPECGQEANDNGQALVDEAEAS